MITRHIFEVKRNIDYGHLWEIWWTDADAGTTRVHVMPDMLPAHLSAAYGIDMSTQAGVDEVIETVVYQQEIPDFTMPSLADQDPAMKLGHSIVVAIDTPTFKAGQISPVHLYNASDLGQAKLVHGIRVEDVKKRIQYIPFTEVPVKQLKGSAAQMMLVTTEVEKKTVDHPYAKFRSDHGVTADELAKHQKFIEGMRLAVREGRRLEVRPDRPAAATKALEGTTQPDMARRFLHTMQGKRLAAMPSWVASALSQDEIDDILTTE